MNVHLENVDLSSRSGPNHFAGKLVKYLKKKDILFDINKAPDARLCFIESYRQKFDNIPLIQRLDGIYFNNAQNYNTQNANIKRTYDNASSVIFQSEFNKSLITKWFGAHKNGTVIHNGADLEKINSVQPLQNIIIDRYEKVWACASQWRPHKRLDENIKYFLKHSSPKDCLVVAGKVPSKPIEEERIFYVGDIKINELFSLYKRADYLLHLAWLDHCPNVVVDARASGCQIICSSAGGTAEISGDDAIIIEEDEWDYEPVDLYNPPKLDFSRKVKNSWNIDLNMEKVSEKYARVILGE
jgi:glycosyltransferase involved in cell wall biosynthesis